MGTIFDWSDDDERSLALHRVCRYALLRERLDERGPGPGPDFGWLDALRVEDLISGATPFFWHNVGRAHLALSADEPAPAEALAALAMTGFDAFFDLLPDGTTCPLPSADGLDVVLPRLGLRPTADGRRIAGLRRTSRRLVEVLDAGGASRTIPLDDVPPADRLPCRAITTTASLMTGRHPALFSPPYLADVSPGPDIPAGLVAILADVLGLIRDVDPELGHRIESRVGWYVPVISADPTKHRSFTAKGLDGVIFLSESPQRLTIAEAVVHEFHHLILYAKMEVEELLNGGSEPTFYSPWRDDARPLEMLLHALFVFAGVAEFLRRVEGHDVAEAEQAAVRARRHYIARQLRLGLAQAPAESLTDAGRGVLRGIEAVVDRAEAELSALGAEPPPRLVDHFRAWCAAHPHLARRVRRPDWMPA